MMLLTEDGHRETPMVSVEIDVAGGEYLTLTVTDEGIIVDRYHVDGEHLGTSALDMDMLVERTEK